MKFNKQKALAGLKREAKKMPARVVKQLPNAAMFMVGGGVGAGLTRMAAKRALTQGVKIAKPVTKGRIHTGMSNRTMRIQDEAIMKEWAKRKKRK